jgi:galactose mutarotase-like enzyme
MDSCFIANQQIRAEFVETGAELRRFQVIQGPDLLWGGDPEIWGRVAPVLFPIVGQLKGERLKHGGKTFSMSRHGFARDRAFSLVRLSREACTWVLRDDEQTREQFPFPFELWISYTVEGPVLKATYEVRNPGREKLPASLGAHPAFRWPLPGGSRDSHRLEFAKPESEPISRLVDGLLDPHPFPNPVDGSVLRLRDDLFTQDALVFDHLQSRSLRYLAPGSLGIEVSWEGFQQLGLWTIPGASFLCIEPWAGTASPTYFDGEFVDKPGLFFVEPGGRRLFRWSAKVLPLN